MRPLRIALYQSAADNLPTCVAVPWETLVRELLKHEFRAVKGGRAWSPADYPEGATRGNVNVRGISLAVFDLEHTQHAPVTEAELGELGARLQGVEYVCHSTHTPGCYRLILPLSRDVLPAEWPSVWAGLIQKYKLPADSKCGDLQRLFYLPEARPGSTPLAERGTGAWLDPGAFVGTQTLLPPTEKFQALEASTGPIDLDPLRAALRRVRKAGSAELAKIILSGHALAEPGARGSTINAAASLVATACDPGTPRAAALAILEPGIRAMATDPDRSTGQARTAEIFLAQAADSYDRAAARRAANDQRAAQDRAAMLAVLGVSEADPKGNALPAPAGEEWRRDLLWAKDKEGNPSGLKSEGANAELIFRHDNRWKQTIRFNEVTKQIDISGGPLAGFSPSVLNVEAANWLARSEYHLCLPAMVVGDQLLAVARRNAYDPLADYLNAAKWDGTPRLDTLLISYFGAADTEHNRRISRRWMVSAVARALKPGCKVDTVLILEGGQGKFKSTALKTLTAPWFSDTKIIIGDKDSRMMAAVCWMIEMGELTSFRASDAESLKAFFSASEDRLRPPYGRVIETFLRRAIFVGTTNGDEYLNDPTGSRRYWPVRISCIDIPRLELDRDQLWAEAAAAFKAGERWWLEGDEQEEAEKAAAERASPAAYRDEILDWILRQEPEKRPGEITTREIAAQALFLPNERITVKATQEIGVALRLLNFTKHRQRRAGIAVWVYRLPESLRTAPVGSAPRAPLALLPEPQVIQ